MKRHRHQEPIRFLNRIDRQTLPYLDIHLIIDNWRTHEDARWFKRSPAPPTWRGAGPERGSNALDSLAGRELDEGEPGAASRADDQAWGTPTRYTTHLATWSLFGSKVVLPTSVPSMTQDSQTLDYVRFSGYENTSMHMAVSRGSGAIGTADRGPEHAAEGGLALADRASVGGGMRHHGDHAAHRDIKADGVALAGALPGGRGRWPVARQEPAAGDAAAERRHQDAGG